MGKINNQNRCKYCGAKSGKNTECGNCREKLRLIRRIRAMLLTARRNEGAFK